MLILSHSFKNRTMRINLDIPYHFPQYYVKQYCGQCIVLSGVSFCVECFSKSCLVYHFMDPVTNGNVTDG
jgi:hypothetical protein